MQRKIEEADSPRHPPTPPKITAQINDNLQAENGDILKLAALFTACHS